MAVQTTSQAAVPAAEKLEAPPQLVDGVELIGEYKSSGMSDPPFIARRPDGQVVQMKRLLYLVAEEVDGKRGYDVIAERATERYGLKLRPEMALELVDRLRALGIAAAADGSSPQLKRIDPLVALRLRAGMVPAALVQRIGLTLRPLFLPPVVVCVLAALVVFDIWLFGYHGIAQSVRQALYQPEFILLTLGLVVLSAAFHEFGHASACAYGGARPGKIGFGIFIVWPAFYTDVTDAYRLNRAGRLRTDLGGVYFNALFILATAAAYAATGFEPLLLIIPLQHAEIIHQLLPFVRLDGYYVISDLAGVPNMVSRIKPTLASLLPWRKPDASVAGLKPWVRATVSLYVLTVVPLMLFFLFLLVLNVPRILATSWDSGRLEAQTIAHGAGGDWAALIVACIQLLVLVVIPVGLCYTLGGLAWKTSAGAWRVTERRPAARAGLVLVVATAAAFAAYAWLPADRYRPIQAGEEGTFGEAVGQLEALPHVHDGAASGGERRPLRPARSPGAETPPPSFAPGREGGTPPARGDLGESGTTGRSPNSPVPVMEGPPAAAPADVGRTTPGVTSPAATVSTPITTATVPAATNTLPSPTVPVPGLTATLPGATATVPSATVPTPITTTTTPTVPVPVPPPVPTVPTVPTLPR